MREVVCLGTGKGIRRVDLTDVERDGRVLGLYCRYLNVNDAQ